MRKPMYHLTLPSVFMLCAAAFALSGCITLGPQQASYLIPPDGIEIVARLDQ